MPSAVSSRCSGGERDAVARRRDGCERSAAVAARSATVSSQLRFGITSSTSFHSTACFPRTPSDRVANTSARSLRTRRLSITRVRPPVPGSTPSSGTSGSDTAEELSSISRIWSHANASS